MGPIGPVLAAASLRHALRHPWQLGLSVLGIALGVAVVVAIELANASAERAFDLSTEAVMGRATHAVRAGPRGVDERLYVRLRRAVSGAALAPVVEAHVTLRSLPGRTLTLLGVDPLAEAPFRPYLAGADRGALDLVALLTEPATVFLGKPLAERLGVAEGGRLVVESAGRARPVTVVGILRAASGLEREALADLLLADIATAQELLDRVGRLTRIDARVPEGEAGARLVAGIERVLPPGTTLEAAGSRAETSREMTRAFRLNLLMLSLLALVVGMFLIYNTMTFSVVQRRELIGALRALGVTRTQVMLLVLGEALLMGAVGALAGLALGVALATELVGLVTRTINDLYFVVNVREIAVPGALLAKGTALALGAALAAAALPALEATRVAPRVAATRSLVESRALGLAPRLAVAGAVTIAASLALLALFERSLGVAFVALFGVVAGATLMAPLAILALVALARPLAAPLAGVLGRLAVRGVSAHLSRTGVAIAALMVALAATVGVGVMVKSFRHSVAQWLEVTLRADLYVSLPGPGEGRLSPSLIAGARALPGVAELSLGRSVTVESAAGPTEVVALRMASASYGSFRFVEGAAEQAWPAFEEGDAVLVTEPYAFHHGLGVGDRLKLATARGEHAFAIAGVVRDYGSGRGSVIMSDATFIRFWEADGYETMGVYLEPQASVEAVTERLRRLAAPRHEVFIRSNRSLRETSLEIFDRTFAITHVLRLLSTLVAFVGVLSAFMALGLERAREFSVLRAVGVTRNQVHALLCAQSGFMGLIAGLLSWPLGLGLAALLVGVVNRRSFGWSIDFHVDPAVLAQSLALALLAGVGSGLAYWIISACFFERRG